ncbi:MAG: hypothetical protein K9H26_12335 [Prolixibacteraceae bacterium]|nr:hypothetical protein [Prolixibacteraceae bacterium]
MRIQILTMFFLSIIFFSACEKDEYDPALSSEGKISSIENEAHEIIARYAYKDGRLVKSWNINAAFHPDEKEEFEYKYNSKGLLIEQKGYQPGIIYMSSLTGALGKDLEIAYKYDDFDRLEKVETKTDYGDKYDDLNRTHYQECEYPDEKTVRITSYSADPLANSINGCLEYFFDDNENIEKIESYYYVDQEKRLSYIEEYSYDSKLAPFNISPGPKSKNNMTKKEVTAYNYDEAGNRSVAYTSTYNYEYTYNSLGFPTSKTETYPNETVIVEYYNY